MTLNEAIAIIEDFGSSHLMVNDTIFGAAPEIDTDDLKGFVLWFYLNGSEVEETRKSFTFDVRIMDVLQKDMSNEIDGISDTDKIAQDLLAWLDTKQYDEGYQFDRSATKVNFVHYDRSDYVGHQLFVTLHQKAEFDVCEAAMYVHLVDENGTYISDEDNDRILVE